MKTKIPLLFILIVIFSVSCTKEINIDDESKSWIIFGDTLKMSTSYHDTIIHSGIRYENDTYKIDIDMNGSNDIQFMSYYSGSMGSGFSHVSSIESINPEIELYGYYTIDTIFRNESEPYIYYDSSANCLNIEQDVNFSCFQTEENYSIYKINSDVFKIIPRELEDTLHIEDLFSFSKAILKNGAQYGAGAIYGTKDTAYTMFYNFFNDCYSFPINEQKYIGLKMILNDEERLGWIRIGVNDKDRIYVYESSLQR